jgi:hypothetical protein
MDRADIENRFTYHPPHGAQPELYQKIRARALSLSLFLNEVCPDSREKSLAMTALEECAMWANAAIARNG